MSTPKAPAFQLYANDFLVGTTFFTAEQVGAYIRLLCQQWVNGGLPNDPAMLANASGCHGNAVASVIAKFELCDDGQLRNRRLEEVREGQVRFREKQSQNAKEGWEKRRSKTGGDAKPSAKPNAKRRAKQHATDDAKPVPDACSSTSSSDEVHPIVPQNENPAPASDPPPADVWDEDREICRIVWEGHPQTARARSSKEKVAKAWEKVPKRDRPDYDEILGSLALWRGSIDWVKDGGQFVAGCHLWIKDRKWTVTPVPARRSTSHPAIGEDTSADAIGKI